MSASCFPSGRYVGGELIPGSPVRSRESRRGFHRDDQGVATRDMPLAYAEQILQVNRDQHRNFDIQEPPARSQKSF